MSDVLAPFEVAYDADYAYESCVVEIVDNEEVCTKRSVLEKNSSGPIIPDLETWIVIPGMDEKSCLNGDGIWLRVIYKE